jgi:diguanylate cyclase (GGDEF)-like protein
MLILHLGIGMQWWGAILMAALFLLLTRSINRPWLKLWLGAWTCLLIALSALRVAFTIEPNPPALLSVYLAFEYGFGLLFLAGVNSLISGRVITVRDVRIAVPFVAVAVVAPILVPNFNRLFSLHAGLLAGLFAAAFLAVRKIPLDERGPGSTVVSASLAGLTLVFLHYVPTFVIAGSASPPRWLDYLTRSSFIDLILQLLLGIGAVMVTLERINRKLDDANRRLALLARQDPLTDALNRHAFQSMLSSELQPRGGVVAVVDIDYLKAINDGAGHAAGDRALRQVARALRSLIRADDLLFRWGGDEFLVVLDTVDLEHAHRRFDELHDLLAEAEVPDSIPGGRLSASFGLAEFSSVDELDDAISTADERMYRQRRSRRGRETHV